MARPTTITEDQILRAARRVFLRQGAHATTADVAREAGIAEGSIFKRFRTKAELFTTAMQEAFEDPEWLRTIRAATGDTDGRAVLLRAGVEGIAFFRRLLPLIMMSWSNPSYAGHIPPHLCVPDPPPVRALREVTAFFKRQISHKRIRRCSPEIAARIFIGSVSNFVFLEVLDTRTAAPGATPVHTEASARTYIQQLVQHLYAGIELRDEDQGSER